MAEKEIKMGGQAVIEGVMMRSTDSWAVAVRSPKGNILVKKEPWHPVGRKIRLLELPILRGMVILIETIVLGIKALSFSADVASTNPDEEEDGPEKEDNPSREKKERFWWIVSMTLTVVFSFALGLLAFFYLPLYLTELMRIKSPLVFNMVDGILRVVFFIGYLLLISRWSEIRRIFEYHGAEHKTIFAHEDKKELTWENISPYLTFHPRCGTSFVIVLLLVSILVFMMLGKPDDWSDRVVRFLFIPLIGGISYELTKLSSRYHYNPFVRLFIAPGLWLQRITTRPPDKEQVEVAVVALRAALGIEQESAEVSFVDQAQGAIEPSRPPAP